METTPSPVAASQEPDTAPKQPIFEGQARVIKVTPPDYSMLLPGSDRSGLKADVTLRSDAFADIHFPIDRNRIAEFEALAFEGATIPIRIG